jgi:hypothetical protein
MILETAAEMCRGGRSGRRGLPEDDAWGGLTAAQ